MIKKVIFIGYLFFLAQALITYSWAQENSSDYVFVNIKEDISKVAVSSIVQDNDGFIWIGTVGVGLYKFDGINYTSYKHVLGDPTSLSNNRVEYVYLDNKNNLWVGTENGLNLYNRTQDIFKRIDISDETGTGGNFVETIVSDGANSIYFGSNYTGYFKLNIDDFSFEEVNNLSADGEDEPSEFNCSVRTKDGRIFVGTNQGLREIDFRNNRLIRARISAKNRELLETPIESIYLDSESNLWLGTIFRGVVKLVTDNSDDIVSINSYPLTSKKIMSFVELDDKSLMIATENNGLFHIDQYGNTIKNYLFSPDDNDSIKHNSIWSLYQDKDNRIWLGYYNEGVAVYDELYDKFDDIRSIPNYKNSLSIGSVMSLLDDDEGKIWIALDGGGIDVFDPKTEQISHINTTGQSAYNGLDTDYVLALFRDSIGNIWIGTWDRGFFILKKGTKELLNYSSESTSQQLESNSVMTFAEDSDGIIWIGSFFQGLHSFNPKTNEIIKYDDQIFVDNNLHTSNIRKILIDEEEAIWIGTDSGLFRLTKTIEGSFNIESFREQMSAEFKNYSDANNIISIYECSNGQIWIGTNGAGLCKYNKTANNFTWYNKTNGLIQENVTAVIEANSGELWVSGHSGITKFDTSANSFTNYTYNDGLLSNDFNVNAALKDKTGKIYFGNYKGVDYFDPGSIKYNENPPLVYIKDLKLFNRKVVPNEDNSPLKNIIAQTDSIILKHNQSVFTIDYSTISFTRPEKNSFAYYLEGLEESWNYVGNARSITYTSLDEGYYTFKVKAANNDGIWNETPVELSITILPPWWRTNWAVASYLALFFFGVFLLNKLTRARIKEKQIIKNERIQRRQQNELNNKKIQFFTNISHEFRTPLTLIINPLKDILNNETLSLPEEVKDRHKIIYKNTHRLYRLINELMDFRKLEFNKVRVKAQEIDVIHFAHEVISYFQEAAASKNIFLSVDSDVPDVKVWADKEMLEKIIFNLLSNAIKVTPQGGAINIDIRQTEELFSLPLIDEENKVPALEIIVSDTGPGLKKEEIERIFERFYQVKNLNETYYGGTGIGLEVVQNFVALHKGKIEVESDYGKGTAFKVLLPVGKEHFSKDEIIDEVVNDVPETDNFIVSNKQFEEQIDDSEKSLKRNTLLIVEDNTELLEYLESELNKHYKVVIAADGKEGLKVARETVPEIIVSDVIMPKMNGFDFCKAIKSDSRTSHIPILMLTAKANIDTRIASAQIGADAFMEKPFDLKLLKLRLAQLIDSRKIIFEKYFSDIAGSNDEYINAESIDKEFMQKLFEFVNENLGDPNLSVELLAAKLNLSRSQLYRKIKAITGQTVNEFIRKVRLERAKRILQKGSANISEVCYSVGFSSPSYFTKCFKAHFGLLPTEIELEE